MDLKPTPIAYILHFETVQDKIRFSRHMERYSQVDELYYDISRTLAPCFVKKIPERFRFRGKLHPILKERRPGRPEDIKWENLDIGVG